MSSKRVVALAMAVFMLLGLTACTSLGDNSSLFFSEVSATVNTLVNSKKMAESKGSTSESRTALEAPANFTVDEKGNYSFSGVENADYYQLYICEPGMEDNEYLVIGNEIKEDGSSTYTGLLSENMTFSYGHFDVRAVAWPSLSDGEHKKSVPAVCEYFNMGEVDTPQFAYYWNGFTGNFDVQLTNIANYQYEKYPEKVDIVLTNEADSSDQVTLTMENPSLDTVYSVSTTDLKNGSSYRVEASTQWDSECVTNAESKLDLGTVSIREKTTAITEGYGYLTDIQNDFGYPVIVYQNFDYPAVAENFDLEAGGSMGFWYAFTPSSINNKGEVEYVDFSGNDLKFVATPTDPIGSASHSYTFVVEYLATEGSPDIGPKTGTLSIYDDGTFVAGVDYSAGPLAFLYCYPTEIQGTWEDNGDGTINLYYDHSTTKFIEYTE